MSIDGEIVADGRMNDESRLELTWRRELTTAELRDRAELTITGPDGPLTGIDVDMAHISDLVPTIAVLACLADGPTRIRGVGFIRAKESDRLGDLATELRRCGAVVEVLDDGLAIDPSRSRLHGARVATHHDHRLAMAFAVLGAAIGSVEILEPQVVSKSWPGFWDMLASFEQIR